jgi:hypothetical protein
MSNWQKEKEGELYRRVIAVESNHINGKPFFVFVSLTLNGAAVVRRISMLAMAYHSFLPKN